MSLKFFTRLSYAFLFLGLFSAYMLVIRPLQAPDVSEVPAEHIVFQVSPPDAKVLVKAKVGMSDSESLLGPANTPISKAELQSLGDSFTLVFKRDDFQPVSRDFSEMKLQILFSTDRYPSEGPIDLIATSHASVIKAKLKSRWPWGLAAVFGFVAFVILFFKQETANTLAQTIVNLEAKSGKDKYVGTKIKEFRITKYLDDGLTWGAVYEAVPENKIGKKNANDYRVAVKIFALRGALDNESNRKRFANEGDALKGIVHPHIVEFIDAGETDDELEENRRPYLIFKYISGETLAKKVLEKKTLKIEGTELTKEERSYFALSPQEVIPLLGPIVQALQFAHDKGLVHRDIKPDNIKIDDNGRPVLLDFGLSKIEKSSITATGVSIGTPLYAAPEMNVEACEVNYLADQFSFGVMLYHIIAGHHPYGPDDSQILTKILLLQEPPLPLEGKPYFTEELNQVMQKMMAYDPKDRFASITEAFEAFKRAINA